MAAPDTSKAAITIERVAVEHGPPVIVLKGEFENTDDPQALRKATLETGSKIVSFDSNGGSIAAAMEYGRTIRSMNMATMQMRATQCASACMLAFVGGSPRIAEPGSVGVHQSSFSPAANFSGPAAVAAVQSVTAQIMTYLIEMGVDPKLLQLSLSIPHDDMRYLTTAEMRSYGVISDAAVTADTARTISPTDQTPKADELATEAAPSSEDTAETKAIAFLRRYNDNLSRTNAVAMLSMEASYAPLLEFYGQTTPRSTVMAEKLKFVERWPVRAYSLKAGSERVACTTTCQITGIVDWFATTPTRDRSSSGSAEYVVTWDPVSEKIVSENGKVASTDKFESRPVRILAQWHDQNGTCRGGSGSSKETLKACDLRDEIGSKLTRVGWCFGEEGQAAYQMQWHACADQNGSASGQLSSAKIPIPKEFAVSAVFSGRTKLPDFRGRDREYNNFRTRIRDGMKDGPNFAGHYTVIQIGCGTGCSFVIVADNKTGKPQGFPRGGEDNMYLTLSFEKRSRLLAAQWADYSVSKCYVEHFELAQDKWKPLSKIDIGAIDACYEDITKNLRGR